AAQPRAVSARHAVMAQPARRQPAVQLHHELRNDALLREPAAETLAPAAAGYADGTDELARDRLRRRRHRVLGGGLLSGDRPALIAAPASRKRCSSSGAAACGCREVCHAL